MAASRTGSTPRRTRPRRARAIDGLRVPLKRLAAGLPLPSYARDDDAGLDLHAAERAILEPGERKLVPTGVAVAIPPGFAGFVVPRSGLALRHGVTVLNGPGLIDAGYRGEVKVLLVNLDPTRAVTLERGDRVAQLVVLQVAQVRLQEVDALPGSTRGAGGFGSTGS
jgi:dUTP diphosphatase